MSRADEFLSVFNEIESLLYKKVGATGHRELESIISELANRKQDRVVLQFRDDLREFSELNQQIFNNTRAKTSRDKMVPRSEI